MNGLTLAERNPLAIRAAAAAAVTAVVHLVVVFGVPVPDGAEAAIGAVVDAVGLLVLILWARPAVTPNAKVITRVTTDGGVVTGEASGLPAGRPVPVEVSIVGVAPRVDSTPVRADLLHSAGEAA